MFLFGSWAKATAEPASDIDIAVLGPRVVDDMLLLRLRNEIAAIPTLRRVDLVDLNRADERFQEISRETKTVANCDSAIKRFELTFELAWKSAKAWAGTQGVVCRSPRDCVAQMFRLGLIVDDPLWLKMIEDRNLSVHAYNGKLAEEIYARLRDYLPLFAALNDSLDKVSE